RDFITPNSSIASEGWSITKNTAQQIPNSWDNVEGSKVTYTLDQSIGQLIEPAINRESVRTDLILGWCNQLNHIALAYDREYFVTFDLCYLASKDRDKQIRIV